MASEMEKTTGLEIRIRCTEWPCPIWTTDNNLFRLGRAILFGPSDRTWTCGLVVPNHPCYQLHHTRILNFPVLLTVGIHVVKGEFGAGICTGKFQNELLSQRFSGLQPKAIEPPAHAPKECRELFYNIFWTFIAVFAPFNMLFRTLRPQVFHVVQSQLWQNMWSKTFPGLGRWFSPPQAGKRFAFQVKWIVTLGEELCKSFLREGQQVPRYKQWNNVPFIQVSVTSSILYGGMLGLHPFNDLKYDNQSKTDN